MKIGLIKSYIGFAIKSGNVIFGSDKLFEAKKMPNLVLMSPTVNEKVGAKVSLFCKNNAVFLIKLQDITLEELVSLDNCKVIGITDTNLANAIRGQFEMENK